MRANISLAQTQYPVGSDISIPCDVEGYPIPRVVWYKDNKLLQSSGKYQITGKFRNNKARESEYSEYKKKTKN